MRRLPILPTLVVGLAVATMIGLGLWQLRRAEWKEGLLATYRASRGAPDLSGVPAGASPDSIAFRHAHILCRVTSQATLTGGADAEGRPGFRNIVACRLADGRTIMADLGWSPVGAPPAASSVGRKVEGRALLIPDEVLARRVIGEKDGNMPLLAVIDGGTPDLKASIPPAIEMIPNNHRSYAVQWFLFAAVALVIYGLALWKRNAPR